MSHARVGAENGRLTVGHVVVIALVLLSLVLVAGAGGPSPVVRVEEDWELVVGDPDPSTDAPQITCTMSTDSDLIGPYATMEFNHRSQPSFEVGGLQLVLWNSDLPVSIKPAPTTASLSLAGETIRWTSSMELRDGRLLFQVSDGSSDTWGDFSGLEVAAPRGDRNLNDYSPEDSVRQSGVTYGGNRVASFVLLRTRKYFADGTVQSDATPRVVFSAVLDPQLGTGPEGQP